MRSPLLPLAAALAFAALSAGPAAPPLRAQASRLPAGVYVVTHVNAKPLPIADRLPSSNDMEQAVRLEEGVLRLRPDGRYVVAVRFHRALVRRGAGMPTTPVMDESSAGRFTIRGNSITFIPDPKKRSRTSPVAGEVRGPGRITVPVVYHDANYERKYVFDLKFDPARW
jgi:hypothetical protein